MSNFRGILVSPKSPNEVCHVKMVPPFCSSPPAPRRRGANAQYACRLRRAGDRLPYWPSNTCTRTGGSPPAPPTPRAKQRKNDADTRGAQRKRKQETKERATKQNTCYTSRFVRVILAQGPCYSSLCRSRGGCCTGNVFLCDEVSFQLYVNGENLTVRTVIWRTPEQGLLHIAPRFLRARAVTKLHTDARSPPLRQAHGTLLDLCVSSLRRVHANLLCIVRVVAAAQRKDISVRRGHFPAISQRWKLDDSHGDLEDT